MDEGDHVHRPWNTQARLAALDQPFDLGNPLTHFRAEESITDPAQFVWNCSLGKPAVSETASKGAAEVAKDLRLEGRPIRRQRGIGGITVQFELCPIAERLVVEACREDQTLPQKHGHRACFLDSILLEVPQQAHLLNSGRLLGRLPAPTPARPANAMAGRRGTGLEFFRFRRRGVTFGSASPWRR